MLIARLHGVGVELDEDDDTGLTADLLLGLILAGSSRARRSLMSG
jgi:hypothetical protein